MLKANGFQQLRTSLFLPPSSMGYQTLHIRPNEFVLSNSLVWCVMYRAVLSM